PSRRKIVRQPYANRHLKRAISLQALQPLPSHPVRVMIVRRSKAKARPATFLSAAALNSDYSLHAASLDPPIRSSRSLLRESDALSHLLAVLYKSPRLLFHSGSFHETFLRFGLRHTTRLAWPLRPDEINLGSADNSNRPRRICARRLRAAAGTRRA